MKLTMTDQNGTLNSELAVLIQRQIGYALSRFEPRIREVNVRLSDLNGPKGGIDKHCRIMVRFRGGGSVLAEVVDVAFEPVIHRTVDRIARRVQRHCDLVLKTTAGRRAGHCREHDTRVLLTRLVG